jgi:hypothetical protein
MMTFSTQVPGPLLGLSFPFLFFAMEHQQYAQGLFTLCKSPKEKRK